MAETFVSLERYLRADSQAPVQPEAEPVPREEEGTIAALRDVRLFRAALAEVLEATRVQLLRDVAVEVLARELAIAPADVERIASRALERLREDEPLRVRASPADLDALRRLPVPVAGDDRLRRGDVTVELHHGTIEISLGIRLAQVLEAFT